LTASDLSAILTTITIDDQARLLRQLRDETATLILMVRLENEKRKDEWRARQEQELAETRAIANQSIIETEIKGLWQ